MFCFTWNNTQKPLFFFPRARIDNQIRNPKHATTPIARLNFCRKAAGFILRMFQLHVQRPREVGFMFRSSCLNLSGPAGIAPCFSFKTARPDADSLPKEYNLKSRRARQSGTDSTSSRQFLIPNFMRTVYQPLTASHS